MDNTNTTKVEDNNVSETSETQATDNISQKEVTKKKKSLFIRFLDWLLEIMKLNDDFDDLDDEFNDEFDDFESSDDNSDNEKVEPKKSRIPIYIIIILVLALIASNWYQIKQVNKYKDTARYYYYKLANAEAMLVDTDFVNEIFKDVDYTDGITIKEAGAYYFNSAIALTQMEIEHYEKQILNQEQILENFQTAYEAEKDSKQKSIIEEIMLHLENEIEALENSQEEYENLLVEMFDTYETITEE